MKSSNKQTNKQTKEKTSSFSFLLSGNHPTFFTFADLFLDAAAVNYENDLFKKKKTQPKKKNIHHTLSIKAMMMMMVINSDLLKIEKRKQGNTIH